MDGSWFGNTSDLAPSDPSVRCGVLKNGLRYALQPNAYPQNRVHAWLEVNTGSTAETDMEQGLAHWLEHCVFLSTDAFPEVDDLRRLLTSLGMSYNADSNAYTDYTVTCYTLEAPFATAGGGDGAAGAMESSPGPDSVKDSALPGLLRILHELVFRARLGRAESERGRRLREKKQADASHGCTATTAPTPRAAAPAEDASDVTMGVPVSCEAGTAAEAGATAALRAAIEREKLAVLSEAAMRNDVEVRESAGRRLCVARCDRTPPCSPSPVRSTGSRSPPLRSCTQRRSCPAACPSARRSSSAASRSRSCNASTTAGTSRGSARSTSSGRLTMARGVAARALQPLRL